MIYCQDCGAVNEADSERFEQMREEIRELREQKANLKVQLEDAERDLRVKRSQISRLKGDRNHALKLDPMYPAAEECWQEWRTRVNKKAREFEGPRADAVMARLRARDGVNDDIIQAIMGAERRAYMVDGRRVEEGTPDQRAPADLELICRNEANMLRFMSYAESPRDTPVEVTPLTKRRDGFDTGGRPLDRALAALIREFGNDLVWAEYGKHPHQAEAWWAPCPLHPTCATPLRIRERKGWNSSLDVACAHGCLPSLIMAELRRLEEKRDSATIIPWPGDAEREMRRSA